MQFSHSDVLEVNIQNRKELHGFGYLHARNFDIYFRVVERPETTNPALGGILSRRLHAFDGAGRCYLALGHLTFIRRGVRSEDPCNHPVVHA